jgi:hypothetical protein
MANQEPRILTNNSGELHRRSKRPRSKSGLQLIRSNDRTLALAEVAPDRFRFDLYPK